MTNLRIGCSGWTYDDWKGPFYPDGLRLKDRLAFYSTQFDACEINGSFYRLPTEKAVGAWAEGVPDGFCFAWKVSRYISHSKKLNDCEDSVDLVFGVMNHLGDRQGPALIQLPPMLRRNDERLARFLGWLPKSPRVTFEFRHPSWYEAPVLKILEDHGAAFCISDHHDAPSPWETTADLVYVRMHGPGGHYHGRYPQAELESLAKRIVGWRRGGRDVHVYFDNDQKSAAPKDAKVLKNLVEPA